MSIDLDGEHIDDPVGFFGAHGHLNDAVIDHMVLEVSTPALHVVIDDLYANLDGRPDYPGTRPCYFTFHNVGKFRCEVDISDGLRIAELRVTETDDALYPFTLEVDFNIGGSQKKPHLVAKFSVLEMDDIDDLEDTE